jgi:hypothetical protein
LVSREDGLELLEGVLVVEESRGADGAEVGSVDGGGLGPRRERVSWWMMEQRMSMWRVRRESLASWRNSWRVWSNGTTLSVVMGR